MEETTKELIFLSSIIGLWFFGVFLHFVYRYYINKNRLGIDFINFNYITNTCCTFSVTFFNNKVISGTISYVVPKNNMFDSNYRINLTYDGYLSYVNQKEIKTKLIYILDEYYNKGNKDVKTTQV